MKGPRRDVQAASREEIGWITKAGLAEHFQVGTRTITSLMRRRILPFVKIRNLVRFNPSDCDLAWEHFKRPARLAANHAPRAYPRRWRTKRQLAAQFTISERTVTSLMRQQLLSYVKVGRLVRFDLEECNQLMLRLRSRTLPEDRWRGRDRKASLAAGPGAPEA